MVAAHGALCPRGGRKYACGTAASIGCLLRPPLCGLFFSCGTFCSAPFLCFGDRNIACRAYVNAGRYRSSVMQPLGAGLVLSSFPLLSSERAYFLWKIL